MCPGRYFVMLEMQLAIAWAISRFEFRLPPSATPPPKVVELAAPINVPKQAFPIHFRRATPEPNAAVT